MQRTPDHALQVFCGMLSRVAQFADIMLDAKQQIDKVTTILQPHHVEHVQGCLVNPSVCLYIFKRWCTKGSRNSCSRRDTNMLYIGKSERMRAATMFGVVHIVEYRLAASQ